MTIEALTGADEFRVPALLKLYTQRRLRITIDTTATTDYILKAEYNMGLLQHTATRFRITLVS